MDEFAIISKFFKSITHRRKDVILGIGDDAACCNIPNNTQLLVSTDSLVVNRHFLENWDPYAIAYKAVMVNVSDIAAMAGIPCWVSLALTIPDNNLTWLRRFSMGLNAALTKFNLALIGGDLTKGPRAVTITIHGQVAFGHAVMRSGAKVGDKIYVSAPLGASALAVAFLQTNTMQEPNNFSIKDKQTLMQALQFPSPRVDLHDVLQLASSAIDISDGLSSDLNHICIASDFGATLKKQDIPIHPIVKKYQPNKALDFALYGGDDYELCFTIPAEKEQQLSSLLSTKELRCYPIGIIEKKHGLRMLTEKNEHIPISPQGYKHF